MTLKELKEKLQKLLMEARGICVKAEEEGRDFTAEERGQVETLLEEAKGVKEKIKAAQGDEALRQAVLELGAGIDLTGEGARPGDGQPAGQPGTPKRQGTLGERFVSSPVFKRWLGQLAPGGRVPEGVRGLSSPPVEFKELMLLAMARKDLVTGVSDTSAGAFVVTDYTGIYEGIGRYPLNVLDLVVRRTTTSDLVEFVRQTRRVQEAAPVPEANVTEYSGATGEIEGVKPEGAVAFERVQAPVKTIAVWIPATKRALSDASQIRGIIDNELRDDLQEELEDQILNGNGVGENFTGLLNTAGILTQLWNTDILTTTRQAITTLQITGFSRATAWVLHPSDWETIELLQDANNRYYWGGPMVQGRPMLWGVPVVTSQSKGQGTALLGDWRKASVWDRERATIQISDSHADFFIRNMVAILAELRAAFGVIRPTAFIEVEMEVGS